MKKRSFFRLGAVLLSASFAISGMNTNITRNVLAEDAPVDETGEMIELVPETQESTESSVEEQETAETLPETAERSYAKVIRPRGKVLIRESIAEPG